VLLLPEANDMQPLDGLSDGGGEGRLHHGSAERHAIDDGLDDGAGHGAGIEVCRACDPGRRTAATPATAFGQIERPIVFDQARDGAGPARSGAAEP
jgi:hypothetical protein